jgi:hypothetical protein
MNRFACTSILAVALALLGLAQPLDAQRRGVFGSATGSRGFFMIGGEYVDLEELNATLRQNGYPEFDETFLTLGGGGFAIRNRLVIGGEGHALLQSEATTTNGQYRAGVFGGYGMFNLGYQVFRAGGFSLYPLVGVGGGGLTLRIRQRAVVDFDDVLGDPGRESNLATGSLLVGGALGMDWFFGTGSGRGGFAIGLRGGYNYAPLSSDWHMTGSDVAGGPETDLTGAWVRISIGGGRR